MGCNRLPIICSIGSTFERSESTLRHCTNTLRRFCGIKIFFGAKQPSFDLGRGYRGRTRSGIVAPASPPAPCVIERRCLSPVTKKTSQSGQLQVLKRSLTATSSHNLICLQSCSFKTDMTCPNYIDASEYDHLLEQPDCSESPCSACWAIGTILE